MQKSLSIGLFIILIANLANAQNYYQENKSSNSTLSIQPKLGYSISKTSFNISSNEFGNTPNVLSELIWSSTHALETGVGVKFTNNKFHVVADLSLNETMMGNVSDFDYKGDNRTLAYSKSFSRNNKGIGYSLKLQPGYTIIQTEELTLTPYLSIDYSSKKLNILNDKDWDSKNQRYIDNLNSYYKYKFPNYGIGAAIDYNFNAKWSTQVAIEGYLSKYYAYGNWNLIEDFEKPISYEHKGNGKKLFTTVGFSYALSQNSRIGVQYNLGHFNVQNGKDYLYHKADGVLRTRLNDANETKHSFLLNLGYNLPLGN